MALVTQLKTNDVRTSEEKEKVFGKPFHSKAPKRFTARCYKTFVAYLQSKHANIGAILGQTTPKRFYEINPEKILGWSTLKVNAKF